MKRAFAIVLLATAARADGLDATHNEIGAAGFMSITTRGMDSGAGLRLVGARAWARLSVRFEYDFIGAGFDDLDRYGYIHRGAASLRWSQPWYREKRGRFDAYAEMGVGRQVIRWRDDATDWRSDFAIGGGIRFDGISDELGPIGYGLGVMLIVAPSVKPNSARMAMPFDRERDVAFYFASEFVLR